MRNRPQTANYRQQSIRNRRRVSRRGLQVEQLEMRLLLAGDPLFRVNAGGPQLTGTPVWQADTAASPSIYSNAGSSGNSAVSTTTATVNMSHASIPAGTPMALFQSERYDKPGAPNMLWDFPVTPGSYEVRLYFAETWSGAFAAGVRQFDVQIEGVTVLDDYDVFADVGSLAGVVKSFTVSSDANLDVDFLRVKENPAIKGIEILTATSGPVNQAPTVNAGVDQAITLPTNSVNLDATVTDDNFPSNPLTTTWSLFSGPSAVTFGNAASVDTTVTFSQAGTYVLRLTAHDGQFSVSDDVQVIVNSQPTSGPAVTSLTLINADTDQPLGLLMNGQTINLADLPTQNLNVRADTNQTVGSVRFGLDSQANFRTENTSPYSLFGDNNGNYSAGSFTLGSHTLTAMPFSNKNATGTSGAALSVTFMVTSGGGQPVNQAPTVNAGVDQSITLPTNSVNLDATVTDDNFPSNQLTTMWSMFSGPSAVTFGNTAHIDTTATFSQTGTYVLRLTANDSQFIVIDDVQITVVAQTTGVGVNGFTLINSVTDLPMFPISQGMTVDLATLATTQLNIRANTNGTTGSVVFSYDTASNFRTDNNAPFSVFGDTGGNYAPVTLALGNHTLTARAYSGSSGGGTLINSLVLNFQVVVGHNIPDQIHVSWTADPSTTLAVVWRTYNTTSPTTMEYRKLGTATWLSAAGQLKSSGTTGTLHQVTLTNLLPSTSYEYRVSGDSGNWSDVHVVKTAPADGASDFDFVYFADTGLVGRPDGLAAGTQQIINDIANLNPLLILGGGDYAYYNSDKRYGPLETHIDAWFNQSSPFLTQSVFMPTLGNHEVRLQESYDAWIDRMVLPATQIDNFNIYSFDVGQAHFVSILAVYGSTALPQSQLNWVINDIQSARARGQTWIIPYMHVSAFADGAVHPSNVQLRNQLGPVFEQLGVHLVVSSHDQNYERTFPLVNVGNGSPIVTDNKLTGYDQNDGIVWLKVSPAGKLSNDSSAFSEFRTNPPPYWTAARDATMHHFARFVVSANGTLTTQIYATPGDGTPSFVYDTFTITLNSSSAASALSASNKHSVVDNDSYDLWKLTYSSIGIDLKSDTNGDGVVNAADYTILRDRHRNEARRPNAVDFKFATLSAMDNWELAVRAFGDFETPAVISLPSRIGGQPPVTLQVSNRSALPTLLLHVWEDESTGSPSSPVFTTDRTRIFSDQRESTIDGWDLAFELFDDDPDRDSIIG